MIDDQEQTQVADSAAAAMNEVLAAEQVAAEVIGACEQEARASLYEAGQHARQIAERTNERIAIIQQHTRQKLKNRQLGAERAAHAEEQTGDREDPRMAVVSAVVHELAARLTGSDSSDTAQAD